MSLNKYSRRRFISASCLMATGTVMLPTVSLYAKTQTGDNSKTALLADQDAIARLFKQKEPVRWVFTGDSITAGVKHTHGYRSFQEIFEERVRWEMHRGRDIVINTAISGHTTANILDDFDWRVTQFKPAVVFLMIGTNDCSTDHNISPKDFEVNLDKLVSEIRKTKAIPVLLTPNTIILEKAQARVTLPAYVEVIKNIAQKNNLVLVDNWAYWKNTLNNEPEKAVYKNWLNDPLHPNGTGHQEIARLIFKTLNIFNAEDPTCGGKYYEGDH